MKDLGKTLETERGKLNTLALEAIRRGALMAGACPSGVGSSVLLGKVIQRQSSKVDRIIMKIYRQGG